MSDDPSLSARVERLEAALAHSDRTVEDLNRMVVGQWKLIDELTLRVRALTEQMLELDERGSGSRPADPPPPHY